jgi:CBS domain-containing protein
MTPSQKPLLTLTAADLMTPTVVVVPEQMSLHGAARLLSRSCISGAPVVDAAQRCVGVVSATDFVRWVETEQKPHGHGHGEMFFEGQIVNGGESRADCVCDVMTHDVVTVAPTATIGELARTMVDAHIHRVIVVNSEDLPIGIISSTDLLAALARHVALRCAVEAEAVEPCAC